MPKYLFPLIILSINFLSIVLCIRFLFSRKGYLWIISIAMSLFLTGVSAVNLVSYSTTALPALFGSYSATGTFILGIISLLWFFVIIIFRLGFRDRADYVKTAEKNKEETFYIKQATGAPDRIRKKTANISSGKRAVNPPNEQKTWDEYFD